MGDADKVLEAVKQGPLPVHVVRQRTGIGTEISGTLAELQSQGKIVRAGEMVGLPEPAYIPTRPEPGPGEASFTVPPPETEEWDALASEDQTVVMGPDVPVDLDDPDVAARQYLVATDYQLVTAASPQQAAESAIGAADAGDALVVEVEHAEIYERAVVTRPKRP